MSKKLPIFSVGKDEECIKVDSDGYVIINKLVLVDSVTGEEWFVQISNGEIITEPRSKEGKRDWKISKLGIK